MSVLARDANTMEASSLVTVENGEVVLIMRDKDKNPVTCIAFSLDEAESVGVELIEAANMAKRGQSA